jgi:hypothetical protein
VNDCIINEYICWLECSEDVSLKKTKMSNIHKYYIACFNRRSPESCSVFPLRQYICKSYVSIVVSGRVWYGWWVGILFPCNLTRLVRGNLQQMHFFICRLSFVRSMYYILFHVQSHCKTLSLLCTCVHCTLPEWS